MQKRFKCIIAVAFLSYFFVIDLFCFCGFFIGKQLLVRINKFLIRNESVIIQHFIPNRYETIRS